MNKNQALSPNDAYRVKAMLAILKPVMNHHTQRIRGNMRGE